MANKKIIIEPPGKIEDNTDDTGRRLDDIHFADLERAFMALIAGWDSNNDLTADEMVAHLEGVADVWDGVDDFSEFIKKTGLKIRNDS